MEKGFTFDMYIGPKKFKFRVYATDNTSKGVYYFCECDENNANRGWFSFGFIKEYGV